MCCVIPPASPAVTLVFLIESSNVVLPWSTCPIIVTTAGRSIASDRLLHHQNKLLGLLH